MNNIENRSGKLNKPHIISSTKRVASAEIVGNVFPDHVGLQAQILAMTSVLASHPVFGGRLSQLLDGVNPPVSSLDGWKLIFENTTCVGGSIAIGSLILFIFGIYRLQNAKHEHGQHVITFGKNGKNGNGNGNNLFLKPEEMDRILEANRVAAELRAEEKRRGANNRHVPLWPHSSRKQPMCRNDEHRNPQDPRGFDGKIETEQPKVRSFKE